MKTNPSIGKKSLLWHRNAAAVFIAIAFGLLLARFATVSLGVAFALLAAGVFLSITIFLRKTGFLLFAWFVLTTLVWPVTVNWFPGYFSVLGRGLFWGTLGCVIVAWAVDHVFSRKDFVPFRQMGMKAVLFAFLFWSILTLFTSIDVVNSLKKIIHIVVGLLVFYMFYDFFSDDKKNVKYFLFVLLGIVVVVSCTTIVITSRSIVLGEPIYKQISLWFRNPNALGLLLASTIPIFISTASWVIRKKELRIIVIILVVAALVFSFSRTSWLAAAVAFAYLFWRNENSKVPFVLMTALCLFIAALSFPVFGEDVVDYLLGHRYTGRREIWGAAWRMACDYPFFGVGPGNSILRIGEYLSPAFVSILGVQDTHSLYLKNAVEMGFPSVLLWFGAFGTFLLYSIRIETSLETKHLQLITRGANATFFAIAVHGIFENGFFLTSFVAGEFHIMMPYIAMAIPFAAQMLDQKAEPSPAE